MFCRVDWWLVTDVSGIPVSRVFKGQILEFDCPESSVNNCQTTLRNIPQKRRSPSSEDKILLIICGYSRIHDPEVSFD
jgi:hypothetical protein